MNFVVVAGTPGAGKTSVLLHTIRELTHRKKKIGVVKVDCIRTDDKARYERDNIPVIVGVSGDMCPDHFSIYNIDDMVLWAAKSKSQILINETAGLCLRCAPYTDKCLAVCVVDVTSGPNTPLKIGPLLTTADIVVMTKGDLVSQAEREVFRERVSEVNPNCRIIEANGLSGTGSAELADFICAMKQHDLNNMKLRHNPPLAICTLCTGELRTSKNLHMGVLRNFDGFERYHGE
jgi:Ni2+-binding GTPase involved in maturation of urease and hydrogenase